MPHTSDPAELWQEKNARDLQPNEEEGVLFDLSTWDSCFDHKSNALTQVGSLQQWMDLSG